MKWFDRTDLTLFVAATLLLAAIWWRHRAASAIQQQELSLDVSQLINRVRHELGEHARLLAQRQEKPVFQLKTFDLEVQFVVKRASKGTAGVELQAVTVETSAEETKERSHKIVLHYEPMPSTTFSLGPTEPDVIPDASPTRANSAK